MNVVNRVDAGIGIAGMDATTGENAVDSSIAGVAGVGVDAEVAAEKGVRGVAAPTGHWEWTPGGCKVDGRCWTTLFFWGDPKCP